MSVESRTAATLKWRARNPEKYRRSIARRNTEREAAFRSAIYYIKLEAGCMGCGYNERPEVLEFDHRPDTHKAFNVGELSHHPLVDLLTEIDKCDVVCANCHRIRTADRRVISEVDG